MDANELKEWNKIRSRELKEKFLKSKKILFTNYGHREFEVMDFTLAEEMLNKYSFEELEEEVLADVELERGNKQNGCLIALDVLQKANGDKTQAGKILQDMRNVMIAYYDYQIEIEEIRSKALRKLDTELEKSKKEKTYDHTEVWKMLDV